MSDVASGASAPPNRILSAAAIGFPLPTDPPVHLLNWKQIDPVTGLPRCSGCGLPIIAEAWAIGTCKGRAARSGDADATSPAP